MRVRVRAASQQWRLSMANRRGPQLIVGVRCAVRLWAARPRDGDLPELEGGRGGVGDKYD